MKMAIAIHEMIDEITRIAIHMPFQFLSSSSATRSWKREQVTINRNIIGTGTCTTKSNHELRIV